MGKLTKIVLGIATILQPLILIGLLVAFFSLFFHFMSDVRTANDPGFKYFELVTLALNLVMLIYFGGLQLFYIVHAARNPNVENIRVQWILGIVFFSVLVTPFYWYGHIWKDGSPRRVSGPLGLNNYD